MSFEKLLISNIDGMKILMPFEANDGFLSLASVLTVLAWFWASEYISSYILFQYFFQNSSVFYYYGIISDSFVSVNDGMYPVKALLITNLFVTNPLIYNGIHWWLYSLANSLIIPKFNWLINIFVYISIWLPLVKIFFMYSFS